MKVKKIIRIKRNDSSEGDVLAAVWETMKEKMRKKKKIQKKYEFLSEGRNPFTGEYEEWYISKNFFYVVIFEDDIEEDDIEEEI